MLGEPESTGYREMSLNKQALLWGGLLRVVTTSRRRRDLSVESAVVLLAAVAAGHTTTSTWTWCPTRNATGRTRRLQLQCLVRNMFRGTRTRVWRYQGAFVKVVRAAASDLFIVQQVLEPWWNSSARAPLKFESRPAGRACATGKLWYARLTASSWQSCPQDCVLRARFGGERSRRRVGWQVFELRHAVEYRYCGQSQVLSTKKSDVD